MECGNNVKAAAFLFKQLGFHLHPKKSIIIPTQNLTFLEFKLDSRSMAVAPTDENIHKTVKACKRLQTTTKPQISDVAEVICFIVSNFQGVQFEPLHYRSLERDKTAALLRNKRNYKFNVVCL